MNNDRFLEDLKNRLNIVDIISKYTELKKSGKNYVCRSPLRNERTPSFSVSPDRGLWYDFGASEGGDAIRFIERIENVSFFEAIDILAGIAGIEVPPSFKEKDTGPSRQEKKDLATLHQSATEYFMEQLKTNTKAMEYLKQRGMRDAVIKEWQLGYGGDGTDGLTKYLLQKGFSLKQIEQSGVAYTRKFGDKTMQDRFEKRIMIPIAEPRNGDIVAFSGREIAGRPKVAKYINSPENPLYHKSSTLFGLHKARKPILDKDMVLMVEGNFDVISAHAAGVDWTVATCGTALTEDHIRMLRRMTTRIVLAFDDDKAGKKATLRAVEMILKADLNAYIIDMRGGKDLDEIAQKNPEAVKKMAEEPINALEYLCDGMSEKLLALGLEGEKRFLDAYFGILRFCQRPLEIDSMLSKVATKLKRDKAVILAEYERFRKNQKVPKTKFVPETNKPKYSRQEVFVGFLSNHWDKTAGIVDERMFDLLYESEPQRMLKLLVAGDDLEEDDKQTLIAWGMTSEENEAEDLHLKQELKTYVGLLKKDKQKHDRIMAAKALLASIQNE